MSAEPAGVSPDADLIRLCDRHIVNLQALNASPNSGATLEYDESTDPLWIAYEETRDAIKEAEPKTVEGMIAVARAAMAEAGTAAAEDAGQFDNVEQRLSWNLARALIRLSDGAGSAQTDG